ncbi:hypothetical protein THZB04_60080 [Vibrio owensii]|nr:hypothetical protein THZB04_60080 [Vibrio owensii]
MSFGQELNIIPSPFDIYMPISAIQQIANAMLLRLKCFYFKVEGR